MRKSKAETAETRKRIVEIAAEAFKSNGIQATGVAEIMATAGLTHGGFYRHFASKENLVAEACAVSMCALVDSAEAATEGGPLDVTKHIENFLSADHRDNALGGCPLVALGSELVRADAQTRRAASHGFVQLIDIVAQWTGIKDPSAAKAEAVFTLSSMVGAVTMSRIVDDPELSDQILEVARKRFAKPPVKLGKSRVKPGGAE
jgi:TetR/AcrR family transcriptional repressor of nem operon